MSVAQPALPPADMNDKNFNIFAKHIVEFDVLGYSMVRQ